MDERGTHQEWTRHQQAKREAWEQGREGGCFRLLAPKGRFGCMGFLLVMFVIFGIQVLLAVLSGKVK